MQKSNINPSIFQAFLESAANAADKGQAQWLTPTDWASVLAEPLPRFRPTLADLSCGPGQLLQGAARPSTKHLFGCDIDIASSSFSLPSVKDSFIPADITLLYSLLKQVGFSTSAFVLNPPWDLHWYRDRLKGLADSDLPAVRNAWAAHDGRCAADTIDSTVASLCIALDLCGAYGEGLLIANESTLQRLIFEAGAPHRLLAAHVWAHLVIPGNICQTESVQPDHDSRFTFQTGVIYFAAGHDIGPHPSATIQLATCNMQHATIAAATLTARRSEWRDGPTVRTWQHEQDTAPSLWKAVAEEWARLNDQAKPEWNITLNPIDGSVVTHLSLFDDASNRVNKAEANKLFELNGRHPTQLVIQKDHRVALERAVGVGSGPSSVVSGPAATGSPWRVDPAVQSAVKLAVENYNAVRAPLYPLKPIQRLGYLDEHDEIVCTKDLYLGLGVPALAGSPCFSADRAYTLRSATVRVKRSGQKVNLNGGMDDVEWNGQELAFFIMDTNGVERVFMEGRLRAKNVKVRLEQGATQVRRRKRRGQWSVVRDQDDAEEDQPIDFTLHDLVDHFLIPDVPDVARINPVAYDRNLQTIEQIEALCALPLQSAGDAVRA